jgi:peptidoglycan hydrolase-like protein with peptidoglycan-binding domain
MKRFFPSLLMAALLLLVWGANAQTGSTPKKKASVKKKSPTTSVSSKKSPAKKGAPRKPAVTWRNRQLSPTPDRYRDIQSALAAKGYMNSEDATGTWSQNSVDALKRFQQDQNLDPSGKINSLSLIALGLGPKREPIAAAAPMAPPAAPPKQ